MTTEAEEEILEFFREGNKRDNSEPVRSVAVDEEIIGMVGDKIRRSYLRAVRSRSQVQQLEKELEALRHNETEAIKKSEKLQFDLYRARLKLNHEISRLLLETSKEFPEIQKISALAIRRGWNLVALPVKGRYESQQAFEIPTAKNFDIPFPFIEA